jgi:hypothetical protein
MPRGIYIALSIVEFNFRYDLCVALGIDGSAGNEGALRY